MSHVFKARLMIWGFYLPLAIIFFPLFSLVLGVLLASEMISKSYRGTMRQAELEDELRSTP